MKFKLEPYHRNVPNADILDDIRRVANLLSKNTITQTEYMEHGVFSPDTARRRFGSWLKALTEAGFYKTRNYNITVEECLEDLSKVSKRLGKKSVTIEEYKEYGKYNPSIFMRHFGSWFKALESAGLERTMTLHVSNEDYFENLEQMWITLGRQPRYTEVQKPFSKYSAGAYEHRFGSWRKALEAFVCYVNEGGSEDPLPAQEQTLTPPTPLVDDYGISLREPPKRISWRLRFLVMRRDNFKCRACGRSPALQPGLVLHVDHVKARIKGGETVMENLQTLCQQCNIGKSDLPMREQK